ncbi:peptidylprolyl isomerase [Flammeovirga yaeyamensis]|uniref:Peptidylprolyl isomerase n=1 Tax=Flammeovirga yaeyamensis TaxID=367791 RepID=A0AAX1N0F5_9BACT|nr:MULTISPECIES: peptidylprolyl isomerase [Flammeovirga]ANQ47641.1 peptidylprolyl isomerase [Flammeovirga sp. MY04]MBB3698684.1 peptidyl-prolyl cis-trans isomerase SurA [Flammeovirga yaeyamensis]NMF33971.1 peptidylprolyl isomerase [Flammeovirga yaeyamensis]QWG00960.1 peptidylprolyl isomerase [Flammeovirga yaeyamensis]
MNIKLSTILGGILTLISIASFAQTDAVPVDKIIAKVDNNIILLSEVEAGYQQMLSSGEYPKDKQAAKCQVLKNLIVNKIMYAKAQIDSVEVDNARVAEELERRMQYFILQAGSQEKLEKTLGASVNDLRDDLRDQVKEQMTVQTMQQQIISDVSITPKQVKKYFESIPKDSIPFLAAEVKVGQIVRNPKVSESEKEKARQQLLDIKKRIEAGEDFGVLAKQYSQDYGSARKGGDLGWHGRGELVPEFEEIALTIDPNEIADPVESDFGFHLIQLLERRGGRFRARHILIRPKSNYQDVKDAVSFLDSIRTLIAESDTLGFEKAVNLYSDDQPTRSNAGYFKNQVTGSSYMATDELDPVVFFAIDTMSVGNTSKPLKYRTEDGQQAVRIIYYSEYKPPHYANLKDDYQKLQQATLNSQKNQILEKWIKSAKNDVFIEIDPEFDACDVLDGI